MNTFNLLLAAIVAIALIGVFFFDFASFFTPQTALAKHAPSLLLEAQGTLGKTSSITLSLKEGDTIYARNLDGTTRSVSFACSGENCCPSLESCPYPLSVTGDRIRINEGIKTTLSARCETLNQLHACTLYIGKEPAQLEMENTLATSPFTLNGVTEYPIQTTIHNIGGVDAENITFTATLLQDQIVAGKTKPIEIQKTETTLPSLKAGASQNVNVSLSLTTIGTFHLILRTHSDEGGFDEEEKELVLTGTNAQLCQRDLTTKENAQFDGIDKVCRKKVFCTGCGFAYNCRETWEKESPLTGGGSYDPENGTPSFVYQIWPSSGAC
jgi:hypothetical protein